MKLTTNAKFSIALIAVFAVVLGALLLGNRSGRETKQRQRFGRIGSSRRHASTFLCAGQRCRSGRIPRLRVRGMPGDVSDDGADTC